MTPFKPILFGLVALALVWFVPAPLGAAGGGEPGPLVPTSRCEYTPSIYFSQENIYCFYLAGSFPAQSASLSFPNGEPGAGPSTEGPFPSIGLPRIPPGTVRAATLAEVSFYPVQPNYCRSGESLAVEIAGTWSYRQTFIADGTCAYFPNVVLVPPPGEDLSTARITVRFYNPSFPGQPAISGQLTIRLDTPPPNLPGDFVLTTESQCLGSQPAVQLSWSTSERADTYTVLRRETEETALFTGVGIAYLDQAVSTGTTYAYTILARNAGGATRSPTVSVTTGQCGGGSEVSVPVTPARVILARGAQQIFSASPSGLSPRPSRVDWSLTEASLGDLTTVESNGLQIELKVKDDAPLREYERAVRARVPGTDHVGEATVIVVDPGDRNQVTGDVFAGGNVANIKVDPTSVVSATGTIENVSTSNTIANYTRETVEQTEALINKIVAEKAREIAVSGDGAERQASISGTFNLNPKPLGNPNDLNAANPEGGVWHVAGDLVIGSTTFLGRGTIVVDGNVTIQTSESGRKVEYGDANALVGIIARGNGADKNGDISISGFESIVGAYYAPKGKITIGENVTVPKGLFVGNSIELGQSNVSIMYDGRITKNPPLGFSQNFTPSISEVTP